MEKKTTKRKKKSTRAEMLLRTDTIYSMLCKGISRANIILYTSENWDITERQTDTYLSRARERLEEDCAMTREAFMAEALAGYRSIREQAEKRGQFMVAKTCLDSMVDLTSVKK